MDRPAALSPPSKINPHAINLWFIACKSLPQDVRSARAQALRTFVTLCDSADLSPFVGSDVDPNPAIRNFLGQRRRLYVRYMDNTGFMKHVYVRKITRDSYLTEYGFAIRIEGWVSVGDDKLWFRKISSTPGWQFSLSWDNQHRYTLKLDPGITLYVRNPVMSSQKTWYVGYEIHCPITPSLQNYKPETILRNLWDSTMISIRPKGTLPQRRI
jgi:hypothetical protein